MQPYCLLTPQLLAFLISKAAILIIIQIFSMDSDSVPDGHGAG